MALIIKNQPANAGDIRDVGSNPGLGRPLEKGMVNPLQYSCLENSVGRGAWRAIVHRVAKRKRKWIMWGNQQLAIRETN